MMPSSSSAPGGGSGTTGFPSPDLTSTPSSSSSSHSFWCYECEASVDLLSPSTPLVCPRCHGDFLEEIHRNPNSSPNAGFTTTNPRRYPRRRLRLRSLHYLRDLAPPEFIDESDEELSQLYDLPRLSNRNYDEVFDRLLRHMDDDIHLLVGRGPSPAPKSSIDAIPALEITAALLNEDPHLLCAVCKDEFVVGIQAKKLPCSHIYHNDCIVPWLMQHNSCPVCRFQLPTNIEDGGRRRRRRFGGTGRIRDLRLEEAVDDFDLGRVLTRIAVRNEMAHPLVSSSVGVSGVSPTQMAEADMGSVGPTNSMETVSSVWHRDGSTSMAGAADRADEDTDVAMSMDRRGTLE